MNSIDLKPWEIVPDDPRVNDLALSFCKHIPMKVFNIKHPRYHDSRVLLACNRIGEHNKVNITEAKSANGTYYISGKVAKRYPKQSNGVINCYAIPMDKLENFRLADHCVHELF